MVSKIIINKRKSRLIWIKETISANPGMPEEDLIKATAVKSGCAHRKAYEDVKLVKWSIENGMEI